MIGVPQRHSPKAIPQPTSFVEGKGRGTRRQWLRTAAGRRPLFGGASLARAGISRPSRGK